MNNIKQISNNIKTKLLLITATVALIVAGLEIWYLHQAADVASDDRASRGQEILETNKTVDNMISAFNVTLEPGTRTILVNAISNAVLTQLPTPQSREAFILVLGLESRFGTVRAKSSAGAVGMAQIMPKLASKLAEGCGLGAVKEADIDRDIVSLYLGACHFRTLYEQYNGNTALAMAAYNSGSGRVAELSKGRQLPEETVRYISNAAIMKGK